MPAAAAARGEGGGFLPRGTFLLEGLLPRAGKRGGAVFSADAVVVVTVGDSPDVAATAAVAADAADVILNTASDVKPSANAAPFDGGVAGGAETGRVAVQPQRPLVETTAARASKPSVAAST